MTRPKFNFPGLFSRVLQYFTLASIISLTLQPWQAAFTKPVAPQSSAASAIEENPFEDTGEDPELMDKWNEDIYAPSAPSRPAQPGNGQNAPTTPKPSVYMKRPTLVPTDEPIKPAARPVALPLPNDNAPLTQKRIQHEKNLPASAAEQPDQAKPHKATKEAKKEKPTPLPEQPASPKAQNIRPKNEKPANQPVDKPKAEHLAPAATRPDAPKTAETKRTKPSDAKEAPVTQPAQAIAPQQPEKPAKHEKRSPQEQPSQKSAETSKQATPKLNRETKLPTPVQPITTQEKPAAHPKETPQAGILSPEKKENNAKKPKAKHKLEKVKHTDLPVVEAKPLPVEEAGKAPANQQQAEKKAVEQAKTGQPEKLQPKPTKPKKQKKPKPPKAEKSTVEPPVEPKVAQPAQPETHEAPKAKLAKPIHPPKPKKDKPFKLPKEPVELIPFPSANEERAPEESQPALKSEAFAKPEGETPQPVEKQRHKSEKIRKTKPPKPEKIKAEPVKPISGPKLEKPRSHPAEMLPENPALDKTAQTEAKPKKERKAKQEKPVRNQSGPTAHPSVKPQTEKLTDQRSKPTATQPENKPAEIQQQAPETPRQKQRFEKKKAEKHPAGANRSGAQPAPEATPQPAASKPEPETNKQAQSPKQGRHLDMKQSAGKPVEMPASKTETPDSKPEKQHRKKNKDKNGKASQQKANEAKSHTAQPLPTTVNGETWNEKRPGKAPLGVLQARPDIQDKPDQPQKGRKKADKKAEHHPADRQEIVTPATQPTVAQPPLAQDADNPNNAQQSVVPPEKAQKPSRRKKEKPAKQATPPIKPAESTAEKPTSKARPAQTKTENAAQPQKNQPVSQRQEAKHDEPEVNRKAQKQKAKKEKQLKRAPQQEAASGKPLPQQQVLSQAHEAEDASPVQPNSNKKSRHQQKQAKPSQAEQDKSKAETTNAAKPFPNPKPTQPEETDTGAFPENKKSRKSKAEKRQQRAEQVKPTEAEKLQDTQTTAASAYPHQGSSKDSSAKASEPGATKLPGQVAPPKEKKHKAPHSKTGQETPLNKLKTVTLSTPDAVTPATGTQPAGEKQPASTAMPAEKPAEVPLETRTQISALAPVKDLTTGLSPELATQFATAREKAIAYEALLSQRQHAPKPESFEPVLAKGQEAAAEILRILEYLDDASVAELSRHMPGYLLLRDEVIVVAPEPVYFREQSKKYGTPTDVAFFDLMSQTLNGYWPVTMEQLTDLSGCTRFGAHDLVKLYGGWQTFRKQHPNAYQATLKDPNMMLLSDIEDQLLHSQAACDGPDSVVDELQTFIKTYPHSELTPKLQARLTAIQKKQEADMVYFQGVQHTLK